MDYTLTITEEELGVIARALVEMPYKTVAPLFDKLNQQVAGQRQAMEQSVPQKDGDGEEE